MEVGREIPAARDGASGGFRRRFQWRWNPDGETNTMMAEVTNQSVGNRTKNQSKEALSEEKKRML